MSTETNSQIADNIADEWVSQFDRAIENNELRPESDGVRWYTNAIRCIREAFVADVSKMSERDIIDRKNNNPAAGYLQKLANCGEAKQRQLAEKFAQNTTA